MADTSKEPTILNLIMLGTGQHRESVQTVLTELNNKIHISSSQSVHLIDGIGGKAKSTENPMMGTYDFDCEYDAKTGKITSTKTLRSFIASQISSEPIIRGEGYKEALAEAITVIQKMLEAGKKPLIINLYGYSRGGDTLLRLANIINNLYPSEDVQFNLFVIDPATSIDRRDAGKARFIPSNVKNYVSILMRDEDRLAYEPQDQSQLIVQDPNYTRVEFNLYNGVHASAQTFNEKKKDANYNSALTYDNIQRFAEANHTVLKSPLQHIYRFKEHGKKEYIIREGKILSDEERLSCYTEMKKEELQPRKKTVGPNRQPREFLSQLNDYFLHGTSFFHDKQHMLLFRNIYPHFFDYFFQKNKEGATKQNVLNDIAKIVENSSLTFLIDYILLNNTNLAEIQNTKILPAPSGIPFTVSQLQEGSELLQLWEGIKNACNIVSSGYDTSIKKQVAEQFKKYAYEVLTNDTTDEIKINLLKSAALDLAHQCKRRDLFALTLIQIGGVEPERAILSRTINALTKLTDKGSLNFFSNSTQRENIQRQILLATTSLLKEFENTNEVQPKTISKVLKLALDTYNKVLASGTNYSIVKNPVDTLLRQSMREMGYLSNPDKVTKNIDLANKVKAFKSTMKKLTSAMPSSSPRAKL